jgi:hypothetical protein
MLHTSFQIIIRTKDDDNMLARMSAACFAAPNFVF